MGNQVSVYAPSITSTLRKVSCTVQVRSIDTTTANAHGTVSTGNPLQGGEQREFGDAGYLRVQKRNEHKHRKNVSWLIGKRPGTRKKLDADKLKAEKIKACVRAKVEYPFRCIKQAFSYNKEVITSE
tara:strand:- start:175 stop:555 length:381 start_codon:yes stop_codon:yes gene_type:complete